MSRYPDLASCAILEDPPIWSAGPPTSAPGRPSPREGIRRTVLDAQSADLETVITRGKTQHPSWAEAEWQPWADAKKHVSTNFLDELATVPPAANWRELLARVKVPDAADHLGPRTRRHRRPRSRRGSDHILPSLQVIRLEGAGHNIRREQFDPFLAAVNAFLAAHARARPAPPANTRGSNAPGPNPQLTRR